MKPALVTDLIIVCPSEHGASVGLVIGILLLGCVSLVTAQPTAKKLGTPVRSMTIWDSLLVRDGQTGRPVLYAGTYTDAGWARLIRYDYARGGAEYFALARSQGAYGLCQGHDGRIYIGTIMEGRIFSFDPVVGEVVDHGSAAGESFVWTLQTGPDGRIYGATYPNAKVVVFDPSTDRIQDLGRMHPTEQYCRDLAVADNGKIFCGIGSRADLVVYDPETETNKSILPDRYKDNSFAYTVESEDNVVYAYLLFDTIVLIFDADTYELLMEVSNPSGGGAYILRQAQGGPVLISGLPGGLMKYNKTARRLEPYDVPAYGRYDEETGIAYGIDSRSCWAYNVGESAYLGQVDIGRDGDGMNIFSLGTGPDGCVYGGVYNLLHLFRYDPSKEELTDLGVPIPGASGEFYSFASHGDKLYMASYTHSVLSVYDPSKAWNPGTTADSNPRKIGPVGDEQYRPPGLVAGADGRIYIGSIPTYGKLGGALSIYDPTTDGFQVHRHIIPNQSVVSLTLSLDGGVIYGGSSTEAGGGIPAVETEAHFFAWDIRQGKVVMDMIPAPRVDRIQSLVTAPDGRIYGCAGTTLFVYDPMEGTIIHKQASPVGSIIRMRAAPDGFIYGISSRAVFRMKILCYPGESVGFEELSAGGSDMTLGLDGRIYFSRGTDLYVLEGVPDLDPPRHDLVIYRDQLEEGWTVESLQATVDPYSTDMVNQGRCQRISFERYCIVQLKAPDPWAFTLWGFDDLLVSVNPGNATVTDMVITKTGPGATRSVSVKALGGLAPGVWTSLRIPLADLGWTFGSRLESLRISLLGSGTVYLDDIALAIPEEAIPGPAMLIFLAAQLAVSRRGSVR